MPEGGERDAGAFTPTPSAFARCRSGLTSPAAAAYGSRARAICAPPRRERDFRPARKAHPAFVVSGLHDLAADLRARGFAVVEDEPLEGFDRLYASDPFGNRVELMEPVAGRPSGT